MPNILLTGGEMDARLQSDLAAHGVGSTIVSPDQLQYTDLSKFSAIWVSWFSNFDNSSGQLGAKLTSFVANGGNVLVEPYTNLTGLLPHGSEISYLGYGGDSVHLMNTYGGVFADLSDSQLSNWYSSFHATINLSGSDFTPIANSPYASGYVTVAESYGLGHVVFSGQDPSFHGQYGSWNGYSEANSPEIRFVLDALGLSAPPPSAPTQLALDPASDSGAKGDGLTNVKQVVIDGVAAANSTVTLHDGATVVGTGTADASGAFHISTTALADGLHSITATASTAGGTSAASAAVAVTIDTQAPAAPTALADSAVHNGYVNAANDTDTQALTGSAEAGSTVAVFDGATQIGTAVADATGAWSFNLGHLADGAHSLTATATDAAGNTGAASDALGFTVDTIAPLAPTVALSHDSGASATDGLTNDPSITVTPAEAGGTLSYSLDGGDFSATAPVLAHDGSQDGTHTIAVEQTDAAGNVSAAGSVTFTLDTVAPDAPTKLSDSAIHNGYVNAANDTSAQALTGAAEAGSTVAIFDGGTQIGTAVADATGAWSYALGHLADGAHSLTASATDAAGNTGAVSDALSFTVDTIAPQPGITDIVMTDLGALITGKSEPNQAVTIYDRGVVVGSATAGADGAFSLTVTATGNVVHQYTEQATDAAGNTGTSSGVAYFTPAANKAIVGTGGDDVLIGRPNDVLTGGDGHDRFVFNPAFGRETITDFSARDDVIQFDHNVFSSFDAVMAHAAQVGANTVITFDAGDTVTLKGVALSSLHSSDFLFI